MCSNYWKFICFLYVNVCKIFCEVNRDFQIDKKNNNTYSRRKLFYVVLLVDNPITPLTVMNFDL